MMRRGDMLEGTWKREAATDRMKQPERAGQLISVMLTIIASTYLFMHWLRDTGFYDPGFDEIDATVLFGPILFGLVPPLFRFLVGRKNASRPSDVIVSVLFTISAIYFLANFMFNMEVFATPLPEGARFLLDWISDDVARALLGLAVVGGAFSAAWNVLTYVKVKEILEKKDK